MKQVMHIHHELLDLNLEEVNSTVYPPFWRDIPIYSTCSRLNSHDGTIKGVSGSKWGGMGGIGKMIIVEDKGSLD